MRVRVIEQKLFDGSYEYSTFLINKRGRERLVGYVKKEQQATDEEQANWRRLWTSFCEEENKFGRA